MSGNLQTDKKQLKDECLALLKKMDVDLSQLYLDPVQPELMRAIFRTLTHIKNSFNLIGLSSVVIFVEQVERVIQQLLDDNTLLTPALISVLRSCRNYIEILVQSQTFVEASAELLTSASQLLRMAQSQQNRNTPWRIS